MEGKSIKLILGSLFLLMSFNMKAVDKSDIYKAFIYNNMSQWKNTIDLMDKIKNKSNDFILELVNYQYGYIAWCIGNKKEDEAENYMDKAEKNIEVLEDKKFNLSMVNAYKAAFYGYRIGLNVLKAPFIGMKSVECAKIAMQLDAKNPFGYIQYANIQYYMPSMFGGSKTEAIQYYRKALYFMELNSQNNPENWNYLSLLTTIAQAYQNTDDLESAKTYYEKVLKFEPEYQWVKNELYPQLLKKLKK